MWFSVLIKNWQVASLLVYPMYWTKKDNVYGAVIMINS